MSYSPVPVVVTGQMWTAADFNNFLKANFDASPMEMATAKGNLFVGTGAQSIAVLGTSGNNGKILGVVNAMGAMAGLMDVPVSGLDLIQRIDVVTDIPQFDFLPPSTYTHLIIDGRISPGPNEQRSPISMRFNDDTGANYAYKEIQDSEVSTTGVIVSESLGDNRVWQMVGAYGDDPGFPDSKNHKNAFRILIPHYRSSFQKVAIARTAWDMGYDSMSVHRLITSGFWYSTAAITKITLWTVATSFSMRPGSTIALYGVK